MSPKQRHMGRVAAAGCVIGNRQLDACAGRVEVHHVLPSDFATVGLCTKHHDPFRTGTGLHGMSPRPFCRLFRVPEEDEMGLLVWANEDMARLKEYA